MNLHSCTITLIALGGLLAGGCTTPGPVISHSLRCDTNAELLASKCAKPHTIASDATFETVVDAMRDDRQALLECGLRMEALQESVRHCNQQAEQLNTRIDDINKLNGAH